MGIGKARLTIGISWSPRTLRYFRVLGVFAYPRKKVQSRISSRLENDPLPLLSVFIDNMHVDEVQIDGGGTEAVITGNMENPGKRLIVLEGDEVEALYGRPRFTHEERVQYFALLLKKNRCLINCTPLSPGSISFSSWAISKPAL